MDERIARSFEIEYTVRVVLDEEALWPDGDAPEHPTSEDVEALIEKDGGIIKVLQDWNLEADGELFVTGLA